MQDAVALVAWDPALTVHDDIIFQEEFYYDLQLL